jgi:hypothetical protein
MIRINDDNEFARQSDISSNQVLKFFSFSSLNFKRALFLLSLYFFISKVYTNNGGLVLGYINEENRFKICIVDEGGVIGDNISHNKQGTKEKNPIEYVSLKL